jgi:hypothetical protein
VALLPAPKSSGSVSVAEEGFYKALAEAFDRGETPAEIAKRLFPRDTTKRKAMRRKIYHLSANSPGLHSAVIERARANMIAALPAASRGLGRRAARRTDAAKLLFEATGLHNPKIKHEHSGEIVVKMDIPRPSFDVAPTEAEVVED